MHLTSLLVESHLIHHDYIIIIAVDSEVDVVPGFRRSYVGVTEQFYCFCDKEVVWNFNGGELPNNTNTESILDSNQKVTVILNIENVTMENEGRYECINTEKDGIAYGDYTSLFVYKTRNDILIGSDDF